MKAEAECNNSRASGRGKGATEREMSMKSIVTPTPFRLLHSAFIRALHKRCC